MKPITLLVGLLILIPIAGCTPTRTEPDATESESLAELDTLVRGGYDQDEMDEAIKRANSEVDGFIAELNVGTAQFYSVKAPIEDNGQTEHFWLVDVAFRDGKFRGKIDNDPGIVTNVKAGQRWEIAKNDISDWMYIRDGKMHGNYTVRPLLKTMPEEQANALRVMLVDP